MPNEEANAARRRKGFENGVLPGVSDWLILERWELQDADGFGLAIELKSKRGRETPEQKAFLTQCKLRGMLCATCRNLGEFRDVIQHVRPLNGRRVR